MGDTSSMAKSMSVAEYKALANGGSGGGVAKTVELTEAMLFLIHATKLPQPVREHRFHSTRDWRLDLAWPDLKIAVECEGGIFKRGRHTRGDGFERDCEKYNEALLCGWLVLRVTEHQIEDGRALAWLTKILEEHQR